MSKIKGIERLAKIAAKLKRRKKKIVFTNGCFDILHYGHVRYLQNCRRLGDILIVGLNSDSSVKKIKGFARPLVKQKQRAAILSALECVDYVVIFNEKTPDKTIKRIKPSILAKGGDWSKSDIAGGGYVKKIGGKVTTVPFVRGFSTTAIIKKIKGLSLWFLVAGYWLLGRG